MINAVQVALRVDRWNPFAYVIAFRGVDLSGAAMHAQVRAEADQSGAPVLDLASTPDRTALGLCLLNVDTSGTLPISYVRIQIPEASLGSAAPSAAELGDDLVLGWDLVVALPGHTQARWLYGSFTVVAGFTQIAGATLANDPVPGAADAIVGVDAAALTLDLAGSDVLALLAVSFGASEATAKAAAREAVQAATNAVEAVPTAASSAVSFAAWAAVSNARSKVVLENLLSGLIDPAGNYQAANDWRRFAATVTPGGEVTSNFNFPANSALLFKRGDGSVVNVVQGTGTIANGGDIVPAYQMQIPAGAVIMEGCAPAYKFFSDDSNDQVGWSHIVILEGNVALPGLFSDALRYRLPERREISPWIGRRVPVNADSFWDGRRWYSDLASDLGIELVNYARGGRTMADALKDHNGNPLTQASVTGADGFGLFLHTNSAAAGLVVGDPGDTPATFDAAGNIASGGATFFSQARGALRTLSGWNPQMLIFLSTPIYRPGVDLIPDYQAAMVALAEMYGCALIEPHKKCGVSETTADTLLADHVHLTDFNFQTRYRSVFYDGFVRNSPLTPPDAYGPLLRSFR